jgi:transposase
MSNPRRDARKLTHSQLTELRIRAVQSVQAGESPEVVAKVLGIGRVSMYSWLALYRNGGLGALDAKKRGGRPHLLDGKSMKWVYDLVTQKNPMQLKFPFALWTSKMVGQAIQKRYGIKLSKASVCRLLNQLGLSPQKPLWRAHQQDPERVRQWLEKDYPKIKKMAKKQGGMIFFGDEAGLRSDHHSGTTWAEKGKTPVVTSTGARFGFNVISAVNAQGEFRFMIVNGTVGAKTFIEFLSRLVQGMTKKVFLIVDGHPSHKAKIVKAHLEKMKNQLELFFLPPYSPELNPDEHVWNDLKNNAVGRQSHHTPEGMKSSALSFLRMIQKTPSRVESYFNNTATRYAA